MASLTLRLEVDPVTKKKNVWVKYDGDGDALPQEHEEQHRALVAKLLNGKIKPEELGDIHIEREGQGAAPKAEGETPPQEREAVKQGR
jgi:hypothetical protein